MSFHVENLEALTRGKSELARLRDGGNKVITRAVGTLKRRLQPQAKRDIAKQYTLPSRQISKRLVCTGNGSSVTLSALGRDITLIKFPARQTASGVTASIEKGKTFTVAHAFIRNAPGARGGGLQCFIREAAFGALPDLVNAGAVIARDRHGYPLLILLGPSVADMLRFPGREDRLGDFVQQTFGAEIDRLVEVARNG